MAPRVSICMPAYNAGPWIAEALASVWAQDYDDLEVVVVDDGSTDDTLAVLAAQSDPRLRVERNEVNLGHAGALNRAIAATRGAFVKFLDADDRLLPGCVGRMAAVLEEHPSVGMVFARRELDFDRPDTPAADAWREEFGRLDRHFGALEPVTRGPALFARWAAAGCRGNWVAEPAGVMVRRRCFEEVGAANVHMREELDHDMWLRLLARYDVGFIPDPLYVYRVTDQGLTARVKAQRRAALDRLWSLEGLSLVEEAWSHPEVRREWRLARRRALRRVAEDVAARRPGSRAKAAELLRYARLRAARRLGRPVRLHGTIPPPERAPSARR